MATKKTAAAQEAAAERDTIAAADEPERKPEESTPEPEQGAQEPEGSTAEEEQVTQDFATGASSACAKFNSAQPLREAPQAALLVLGLAAGQPTDGAVAESVVYIGPSLPYGKLRSSMILKGTQEEIDGFLAEIKEQYPEVTHLLVPPDKLTQALEKVGRKGTILHKYYEDMLAKSRASRKGQG